MSYDRTNKQTNKQTSRDYYFLYICEVLKKCHKKSENMKNFIFF